VGQEGSTASKKESGDKKCGFWGVAQSVTRKPLIRLLAIGSDEKAPLQPGRGRTNNEHGWNKGCQKNKKQEESTVSKRAKGREGQAPEYNPKKKLELITVGGCTYKITDRKTRRKKQK